MGLLDGILDDPSTMGLLGMSAGLLSAGGPSLMPHSFGQALGLGFQGMQQGYANTKQRLSDEQLNALKLKALQGEMADKDQARKDALAARQFMLDYNAPKATPMPAPQSADTMFRSLVSGSPSATPAAAPSAPPVAQDDPFAQRMRLAQAMRASGNPALMTQADALEEHALKFQPKYSTDFRPAMGPDGQMHNYVLADNGTLKDTGLAVKPDMTEVDLGGTKQFIDKNRVTNGQSFVRTATPDTIINNRQARDRLAFDRDQADNNQDAPMDPLAVHFTAQQALAGDNSAFQNFGRGKQGAANLKAVREEMTRMAVAQGMNGADLAAKVAEFTGLKAGQRTAATRSANIEIAANEVNALAPVALDASAKVARSGFLPFGKAQVMFDTNTNDPALRQFAMANTALANAYGQAMARGGTASVADKEHAKELLSTAMDQRSYAAAVQQLQVETKAAQAAPKAVRADLSAATSGRGEDVSIPVASVANIPPAAIQRLKLQPSLRAAFDEKYGAGAAASVLGK